MIDKNKIIEILAERCQAGLNDCAAEACRKRMIEEMGEDEDEIIGFLDGLEDDDLYEISETFQDLAEKLKSDTLTEKLWGVQRNHPDAKISGDIGATVPL